MASMRPVTVIGAALATLMLPAARTVWAQTSGWHVDVVETAVTQGGAVFTLTFHWVEK
jgi:hypothetical protein